MNFYEDFLTISLIYLRVYPSFKYFACPLKVKKGNSYDLKKTGKLNLETILRLEANSKEIQATHKIMTEAMITQDIYPNKMNTI